jgi:hypothetical protein
MNISNLYQRRAAECFALADQISDPQERDLMQELALCWLRLLRANEAGREAASRDRTSA